MSITDLIPAQYRWAAAGLAVLLLMALASAAGWIVQGYRLGEQLERQGRGLEQQLADRDRLHLETLGDISRAAAAQVRRETDKRQLLEHGLAASSAIHHKEITDAEKNAARLRDRLATADLRLSIILDTGAAGGYCGVPAGTGAGGVVHGVTRAQLDPAHAQRIVGITDDGDQGLIALAACQAYARAVGKK